LQKYQLDQDLQVKIHLIQQYHLFQKQNFKIVVDPTDYFQSDDLNQEDEEREKNDEEQEEEQQEEQQQQDDELEGIKEENEEQNEEVKLIDSQKRKIRENEGDDEALFDNGTKLPTILSSPTLTPVDDSQDVEGGTSPDDVEDLIRQRNESIARTASIAHLAALTADPDSVLYQLMKPMEELIQQAEEAVQIQEQLQEQYEEQLEQEQYEQDQQDKEDNEKQIPQLQQPSNVQQQQQSDKQFQLQKQLSFNRRQPVPIMPQLRSAHSSLSRLPSLSPSRPVATPSNSRKLTQPIYQQDLIGAAQQQQLSKKQLKKLNKKSRTTTLLTKQKVPKTLTLSPLRGREERQQEKQKEKEEQDKIGSESDKRSSDSSSQEPHEQYTDFHKYYVPTSSAASSLYRESTKSALNKQLNPTPEGLAPKGSRPPITLNQLSRRKNKKRMSYSMRGDNISSSMIQDEYKEQPLKVSQTVSKKKRKTQLSIQAVQQIQSTQEQTSNISSTQTQAQDQSNPSVLSSNQNKLSRRKIKQGSNSSIDENAKTELKVTNKSSSISLKKSKKQLNKHSGDDLKQVIQESKMYEVSDGFESTKLKVKGKQRLKLYFSICAFYRILINVTKLLMF
ncbi:MAG: hypothetical protein EZS28_029118, partial [Streblomastix strix]